MSDCSHNCGSCGQDCADRQPSPADFIAQPNPQSRIRHVVGIVSGKGGVGKSLTTSMLSVLMKRRGYQVGIMDADLTGPSIPKAFKIHEKASGTQAGILPVSSRTGLDIISVNLLLDDENDPVVWRGPVISGVVKQFWTDVIWDVDYLFIDMPPGTGDVPLTVFQSIPLNGIIVVTSPQELVSMIVEKAVRMANMMNIPIIGLIENMSYALCPDCGRKIQIFGESHIDEIARQYHLPVLAKLPVDPTVAQAVDQGEIERFEGDWLDCAADAVELLCSRNDIDQ